MKNYPSISINTLLSGALVSKNGTGWFDTSLICPTYQMNGRHCRPESEGSAPDKKG